jgi:ATP adenylyltransferase
MRYVGGGAGENGCIFCRRLAAADDVGSLIVHRGRDAFAILNLYPYNTGHLMVAPYQHTADLGGLDPAIAAEIVALTQRSVRALEQEHRPHGFNIGMNLGRAAGAGIPDHLHQHIVPRWGGDTNFMPVTADTKVMPESLQRTYQRLAPYFNQ